jgi:hypothetical protein
VNATQAQFVPGNGAASALYVDSGGALTMTNGIVLTSAAATPHPGDWGGVAFWPGGRGFLSGVQITYAGGGTNPDPSRRSYVDAGLYANQGAVTNVSQTTVDHSGGKGFELDGGNVFSGNSMLLSGNSATNNGDFAVYYDHTPVHAYFANGYSGSGNGHDAVRIPGGTVTSILTLQYPGLPAQIDGTLTVTGGRPWRWTTTSICCLPLAAPPKASPSPAADGCWWARGRGCSSRWARWARSTSTTAGCWPCSARPAAPSR